jgi:hypothetical protein
MIFVHTTVDHTGRNRPLPSESGKVEEDWRIFGQTVRPVGQENGERHVALAALAPVAQLKKW